MYQNQAYATNTSAQPELMQIIETMSVNIDSVASCAAEIYNSFNNIKNIRTPQKEAQQTPSSPSTVVERLAFLNDRLQQIHTVLSESRNGLQQVVGS